MFKNYVNSKESYIIAEVGQNHQGEIELALKYIEHFANLGANAVKFQMRNNEYLFTQTAFNRPYDSENAFGNSYGEHRNFLEFELDEWKLLKDKCIENNVHFMCTPFDELSLECLVSLNVDVIKVASFDLGNIPFLSKVCDAKKPIVVSVGGGNLKHIEITVEYLKERGADFAILHCVSEYPCPVENLGLNRISEISLKYPGTAVGLSDHFSGTLSGPLGYMFGARVFEKHVTFNRANKGTDHSFALEPKGFQNFVRDIQRVPLMQKSKSDAELGNEIVFKKLGKSVCAVRNIEKGEEFDLNNLRGIIHVSNLIPVREVYRLIGKQAKRKYLRGELIDLEEMTTT